MLLETKGKKLYTHFRRKFLSFKCISDVKYGKKVKQAWNSQPHQKLVGKIKHLEC